MNNATRAAPLRKRWPAWLSCLMALLLLCACRMPVVVHGEGFLYGESAAAVYADGYLFDIQEDFRETFWPVPAPGSSFAGWDVICRGSGNIACPLTLPKALWERDDELPLEATFRQGYDGPLTLRDYQQYLRSADNTLLVPAVSLLLEGADAGAARRVFMAPAGMPFVVPGILRGNNYEFALPDSDYAPLDYWLFVSTLDSSGTLASVSLDFGLRQDLAGMQLRPHSRNSPWSEVLVDCASADNPHALCPMQKLPYLGAVTGKPAISDILQRTVVSQGWMGMRFAEVLKQLPADMLRLFSGVTAVVIGADIRPSFFTPLTGAIYIDPMDLWLTPSERASIDWAPDYRSDFGATLQFIPASLYVMGPYLAWRGGADYPQDASRRLEEIIRPLAYVLVHELAHANDAVPGAFMPAADSARTPLDFYFELQRDTASSSLASTYPLTSNLLSRVADVLYRGAAADPSLRALSALDVGNAFAADSANGMYAYSTTWEDTATLVEEVLLYYYFGLDKLESFLDVPVSDEPDCTAYTLRWGSINRASLPRIKERARLVLSSILDTVDVSRYLAVLPGQTLLKPGIGLCESLQLLPEKPLALPPQGIFRQPPMLYTNSERHLQHVQRVEAHARRRILNNGARH